MAWANETNETVWWKTTEKDDAEADRLVEDILALCEGKYNNVIFPALLYSICNVTDSTGLSREDLYKAFNSAFMACDMKEAEDRT